MKAEGEAEAIKKVAAARKYQFIAEAEGQAKAIIQIFGAIHEGNPSNDLLAVKYLDALKEIANGKATKIFLPLEASGILGSIAGISELFKEKKDQESEEN